MADLIGDRLEVIYRSSDTYFAGNIENTFSQHPYGLRVAGPSDGAAGYPLFVVYKGTETLLLVESGTGNVGIGTTNPQATLEVVGDLRVRIEPSAENGYFGGSIGAGDLVLGTVLEHWGIGSGRTLLGNKNNDGGANNLIQFGFGNPSSGVFPTTALALTQDGRAGIGTTTPNSILETFQTLPPGDHSVGKFTVKQTSNPQYEKSLLITVDPDNSGGRVRLLADATGGSQGSLHLGNTSGHEDALVIHRTGNVGIGTANPSAGLEVANGPIRNSYNAGADFYAIGLRRSGDGGNLSYPDLWGGGTLTIAGAVDGSGVVALAGNVGIGTTAPGEKVEIADGHLKINPLSARVGDNLGIVKIGSSPAYDVRWAGIGAEVPAGSPGIDIVDLLFYTTNGGWAPGSEKMRIKANGNVGIGTANPESLLAVKGKITAEEIEVIADVPDHVFKEGYELQPLEELEQYVQEHKHLPNIPSEKDAEGKGVNLGEMQMKLLEKIEELTLYVLELKNENRAQEAQLRMLQDRLSIQP